jgi:glyoxylase I family protein
MSPDDRLLESAIHDHVALSVGDLGRMISFYRGVGFQETTRTAIGRTGVTVVTMSNRGGAAIELIHNPSSYAGDREGRDPLSASLRRGVFHVAFRVAELPTVARAMVAAGARLVVPPSPAAGSAANYAYLADPEGNLLELIERHDGRPAENSR